MHHCTEHVRGAGTRMDMCSTLTRREWLGGNILGKGQIIEAPG